MRSEGSGRPWPSCRESQRSRGTNAARHAAGCFATYLEPLILFRFWILVFYRAIAWYSRKQYPPAPLPAVMTVAFLIWQPPSFREACSQSPPLVTKVALRTVERIERDRRSRTNETYGYAVDIYGLSSKQRGQTKRDGAKKRK